MTKVAVVYHSGYGHTARLAQAVADGAKGVAGVASQLISVADIDKHWDDLERADAIIFGAPTYMGSVSAPFKAFMDASSKVWFGQKWKNKLAAGFTNSGSMSGDKLNSLIQLAVFAAQQSMMWVSTGMMPGSNTTKSQPDEVNRIGSYLGVMAQSFVDAAPDIAPPPADLETARLLGVRVAEAAVRWTRGEQQARAA
jgi:multimeric flavodoxin WrbA